MMLSHSARARTVRQVTPPKVSGHAASASTAAMKASVTSTERLKLRSWPGSRLAATKASMSGWSQRRVAIIAPRRAPADMIVRHMLSQQYMNETGPDASAATPLTAAPLGRREEKS